MVDIKATIKELGKEVVIRMFLRPRMSKELYPKSLKLYKEIDLKEIEDITEDEIEECFNTYLEEVENENRIMNCKFKVGDNFYHKGELSIIWKVVAINIEQGRYYTDNSLMHHFLFSQNDDLILTSEVETTFSSAESEVKVLLPYQERLLEETRLEAKKLKDLNTFMAGDKFQKLSRIKKKLMYKQSRCMNELVEVLGERLELELEKISRDNFIKSVREEKEIK